MSNTSKTHNIALKHKTTKMSILLPYSQCQLLPSQLSANVNIAELPPSTRGIKGLGLFWGQQRALDAINTALHIKLDGYNVFAAGSLGLGKRTMVKRLLKQHAAMQATPPDWVHVNNFDSPREPLALMFPSGKGKAFQKDMHQLWTVIYRSIQQRFGSQRYLQHADSIRNQIAIQQQDALVALKTEGEKLSLSLLAEQKNHYFTPASLVDGKIEPLSASQLACLTATKRNKLNADCKKMNRKLEQLAVKLQRMEEQALESIIDLNVDMASQIIDPKIEVIGKKYANVEGIKNYLNDYTDDILLHLDLVLSADEADFSPTLFNRVPARYQVNVMAHHTPNTGAPIVELDLPTYFNLLGCIEQHTHMGTITTDFSLIRPGALHQANGGYLLIDLDQLLEHPYAWQGLKRALRSKQVKLSSLEQMLTLTGTISLAPQPIPLEVKVILFGEPALYYQMLELDPEFDELFKVRADFDDSLPRNAENELAYIQLIADYIQKKNLLPFDRSALAELLYDASRNSEDQYRLSLNAGQLGNLLAESNLEAVTLNARKVSGKNVVAAINRRTARMGYLREAFWREIHDGTQLIVTCGTAVGQINALTVIHYADSEFGMPIRLTSTVHQGGGDIIDVERTVDLGGSIHAKGMLILTSFIKSYFGRNLPLHFSAALAFEQSYSDIDGDSATLAGICALISAITNIPVRQDIAITGSMNQLGEVQPIGGVNAKIEGFFDACKLQGLTGKQGVIVPEQNIQHLMLRKDVIEAVAKKRFAIYAVSRVEQVLSMMLQTPMGESSSINEKTLAKPTTLFERVISQMLIWKKVEDDEDEDVKSSADKKA